MMDQEKGKSLAFDDTVEPLPQTQRLIFRLLMWDNGVTFPLISGPVRYFVVCS